MFLSVFDIFKVSVGPSSSHTMGPMIAARRFIDKAARLPASGAALECRLYGSLAYTGEGHGTQRAVLCGLMGMTPETYDREAADAALAELATTRSVTIGGHRVGLDPATAVLAMKGKRLPGHPNAMQFRLLKGEPDLLNETCYSVGGGFVLSEAELAAGAVGGAVEAEVPYPFATAAEMLAMGDAAGLSIAQMKRQNEAARHPGRAGERGDGHGFVAVGDRAGLDQIGRLEAIETELHAVAGGGLGEYCLAVIAVAMQGLAEDRLLAGDLDRGHARAARLRRGSGLGRRGLLCAGRIERLRARQLHGLGLCICEHRGESRQDEGQARRSAHGQSYGSPRATERPSCMKAGEPLRKGGKATVRPEKRGRDRTNPAIPVS